MSKMEIKELFKNESLQEGRLVSHSKSYYRNKYPYNHVYFNANIFVKENNKSVKIWWGDIDISLEGDKLKNIAKQLNKTLFILSEHDGRWGNEDTVFIEDKKVWTTDDETPYITQQVIDKIEKQRQKELIESRINAISNMRKYILKNRELPIVEMIELPYEFQEKIDIPFDLLYQELETLKDKFNSYKNKPQRKRGKIYKEYFENYGYFTYGVLDKYLSKKYNVSEEYIINPSSVWLSIDTNKKLRQIDLEVERLFNKNFTYSDFQRYVTCNYCVPNIRYSNDYGINLKSYQNDVFYIRKELVREI